MANNNNNGGRAYPVIMYQKCLRNNALEGPAELLDGCGSFEPGGPIRTPGAMASKACQYHQGQGSIHVADDSPSSKISTADSKHQIQGRQKRARLTPVVPSLLGFLAIKPPSRREEGMGSKPPECKKRLTKAQSERLEDVARRNNWKMFRDYSKEEVAEICSEIGIEKRSLKAWISYHRNERAIKKVVSK